MIYLIMFVTRNDLTTNNVDADSVTVVEELTATEVKADTVEVENAVFNTVSSNNYVGLLGQVATVTDADYTVQDESYVYVTSASNVAGKTMYLKSEIIQSPYLWIASDAPETFAVREDPTATTDLISAVAAGEVYLILLDDTGDYHAFAF